MASIPAYNRYAADVLIPAQDPGRIAEIQQLEAAGHTDDPRYDELLLKEHDIKHVLRMPLEAWPEPVVRSFARINTSVYVPAQGPSELGASGAPVNWDRFDDLAAMRGILDRLQRLPQLPGPTRLLVRRPPARTCAGSTTGRGLSCG